VPGPWRHRFVSANGARFHVVEAGPAQGPLVVLLHGFPQFWWCWRHQLTALAGAGYRAAAMDLRGYGASDKPPRGYDTVTSAADVAGVIRSLGGADAVIVGHDWGGWIAWSMPALQPRTTTAVAALSIAHPLRMRAALLRSPPDTIGLLLASQLPFLPERRLSGGESVADLLGRWSGPGWPGEEELRRYPAAMRIPFVAHSAMEYYRWALRSLPRPDGLRFARAVHRTIDVPVLQLHGRSDSCVPAVVARGSSRWVHGRYRWELLDGVGHYLPEEAPADTTGVLLDWLAGLPR
jgi:pimeloyl-ACP methyl ester carboxylesterase